MIERYTRPEMAELWNEESKFQSWLEVEIQAAKAMADAKIIPAKAYKSINAKAKFDIKRIDEIEAEVNHDVIAFLTAVSEHIGDDAKYLHYGMTSSDVVDTALALRMKRAAAIIDKKIAELLKVVKNLARKHKDTPCIGRTHGVLAEPMTAGLKFTLWYADLIRARERFAAASKNMAVGKISGSVGNFANLPPKIEAAVCKSLGLKPDPISTQVLQRDRHADFINCLALLASCLEKFATEIRNLQRPEIGEMSEGFSSKQKGSSSMPHKKNPDVFEVVRGKCNKLQALPVEITMVINNLPLRYHRDLHVIKENFIPAFRALLDCLKMTQHMLAHIKVTPDLLKNEKYRHIYSVELVNKLVLEGISFRKAYQQVGKMIEENTYNPPREINHTHEGSVGNLCNDRVKAAFDEVYERFPFKKVKVVIDKLMHAQ